MPTPNPLDPHLGKVIQTVAALLVVIIGLRYIAQDLIAPLLLALFFTVLIYPLFRWFRRKGLSSGVSLLLMILTIIVSVYVLTTFLNWSFSLIHDSLAQVTQTLPPALSPQTLNTLLSSFLNRLSGFVYYFIFIPILSLMILLQLDSLPPAMAEKLLRENPSLRRLEKFAHSITLYVVGRFKINLLTGLLFTVSLLLLGIDYPFVWGLLTVLLSFIPYIGVVLAGIPPAILALTTGQTGLALLVVLALIVIDIFAENIADPYIQGRSHKLSMATVVIALIFWTWLLGFVGAIMAVPLTVLLKTIFADYPETRWLAALMEGDYNPPNRPPTNPFLAFFSPEPGAPKH